MYLSYSSKNQIKLLSPCEETERVIAIGMGRPVSHGHYFLHASPAVIRYKIFKDVNTKYSTLNLFFTLLSVKRFFCQLSLLFCLATGEDSTWVFIIFESHTGQIYFWLVGGTLERAINFISSNSLATLTSNYKEFEIEGWWGTLIEQAIYHK